MLYRDFASASRYLEAAYAEAPRHRGIKKSLGYSYLWMGDVEQARRLLIEIPELDGELDAYSWWWINQDRADLSESASILLRTLDSSLGQP
jgi:thioredoxin-like negative regulator of GroEL